MKERLINNILMTMDGHLSKDHLGILEKVLQEKLYSLEVTEMETALSTDFDNNEYCIQMILFKMRKKDLSEKTIAQYLRSIRAFNDYCNKNFLKVTSMDIEVYLMEFAKGKKKINSNASLNNERKYLSACFKWMRKANIIPANPVENVEALKETRKPIDHLQGLEVEELRDYCSEDDLRERAIIEFLLSTACRVGEAENVKIADMDLIHDKNVLLYGSKGRAYRYASIGDSARYHIKKYLDSRNDDCPYLFVSKRGSIHQVKAETIRESLNKIKVRADMQRRVYPHLMRKTSASDMREHGAAIEDIAMILGHKDASTTIKYYAAVSMEHLRNVHSRCSSY